MDQLRMVHDIERDDAGRATEGTRKRDTIVELGNSQAEDVPRCVNERFHDYLS
jgi:hypothetical protein